MNFDSYKGCSIDNFNQYFNVCFYCKKYCSMDLIYGKNNRHDDVKWFNCELCNFHARYCYTNPSYIDFLYRLDSIRMIQILADYAGVYLMEKNKILKIISANPITDLVYLKKITEKYSILV